MPAPDPYDPVPTLWQRRPNLGWILATFSLTVLFTYVAFPPVDAGEAGYVLAVPAVLWAFRRPPFKLFAWTVMGASALAWTLLLGWLHNVTWVGLFLLGPFVGIIVGSWYLAVHWAVARVQGRQAIVRIASMLGLAGLWVMLEWFRGWIFGGFPWLPLAASQWKHPFMLQVGAYAGTSATSFVLVCFNFGVGAYAHRIFFEGRTGLRKRSPEFTVALLILMGSTFPFLADVFGQQRREIARVTVVQPYVPQNEKWDPARAREILATLEQLTLRAARSAQADFIVWPEAVTPFALGRDPNVQPWLESVAHKAGLPILLGTVEGPAADEGDWHNEAVVVDPVSGVAAGRYAKRKLVPFGEFIPLRPLLGWLEKVVPIGGDFAHGQSSEPLQLPVQGGRLPVGVLICYEDIFPSLARASAASGAEVLAVLTNNGWFGEGGAAEQHAAHSVLRAVETRRPVLRCGNGGWSGWIDEYGYIRATMMNSEGSIYFRGYRTFPVMRDLRWHGRQSAYTERGDWFIAVSGALAVASLGLLGLGGDDRSKTGD